MPFVGPQGAETFKQNVFCKRGFGRAFRITGKISPGNRLYEFQGQGSVMQNSVECLRNFQNCLLSTVYYQYLM